MITIRPIPQLYVGDNVSIHCDLIEQDSIIIWERYPYNDPMNRTRLLGPNVPSRYRINNDIINDTYTVSILTISAIVSLDFSTFQCNSIDSATIDLIEARLYLKNTKIKPKYLYFFSSYYHYINHDNIDYYSANYNYTRPVHSLL